MRFAAIATVIAAVVAVPLAWAVSSPSMSEAAFLNATRCAAYRGLSRSDQGWVQAGLNAEARRQPAAIASQARQVASAAAREGGVARTQAGAVGLRRAETAACTGRDVT